MAHAGAGAASSPSVTTVDQFVDADTGIPYYQDIATGQVTWEVPSGAVVNVVQAVAMASISGAPDQGAATGARLVVLPSVPQNEPSGAVVTKDNVIRLENGDAEDSRSNGAHSLQPQSARAPPLMPSSSSSVSVLSDLLVASRPQPQDLVADSSSSPTVAITPAPLSVKDSDTTSQPGVGSRKSHCRLAVSVSLCLVILMLTWAVWGVLSGSRPCVRLDDHIGLPGCVARVSIGMLCVTVGVATIFNVVRGPVRTVVVPVLAVIVIVTVVSEASLHQATRQAFRERADAEARNVAAAGAEEPKQVSTADRNTRSCVLLNTSVAQYCGIMGEYVQLPLHWYATLGVAPPIEAPSCSGTDRGNATSLHLSLVDKLTVESLHAGMSLIGLTLPLLGLTDTGGCAALIADFACRMLLPRCSTHCDPVPMCMSVCDRLYATCGREELAAALITLMDKDTQNTVLGVATLFDGAPPLLYSMGYALQHCAQLQLSSEHDDTVTTAQTCLPKDQVTPSVAAYRMLNSSRGLCDSGASRWAPTGWGPCNRSHDNVPLPAGTVEVTSVASQEAGETSLLVLAPLVVLGLLMADSMWRQHEREQSQPARLWRHVHAHPPVDRLAVGTLATISLLCLLLCSTMWSVAILRGNSVGYKVYFVLLGLLSLLVALSLCWLPQRWDQSQGPLRRCWQSLIPAPVAAAWTTYNALFQVGGRFSLIKTLVLEVIELTVQAINLTTLASSVDVRGTAALVVVMSLNLVVTPWLLLSQNPHLRNEGTLFIDSVLDTLYLILALTVTRGRATDGNVTQAVFVTVPLTGILSRANGIANHLTNLHVRSKLPPVVDELSVTGTAAKGMVVGNNGVRAAAAADGKGEEHSEEWNTVAAAAADEDTDSDDRVVWAASAGRTRSRRAAVTNWALNAKPLLPPGSLASKVIKWTCTVLGLVFFVSFLARVLSQRSECERLVGSAVWAASSPQVYFARGFWVPAACGFGEVDQLSVSSRGLTQLLPHVGVAYSSLVHLDVAKNEISVLPSELGLLSSLRYLNADFNQISNIPQELAGLSVLETLKLSQNPITFVPPSLFSSTSLRELDLTATPFVSFVWWENQPITVLPPLFVQTVKDTAIELHLSGCDLSIFPYTDLQQFPLLQVIDLSHNRISSWGTVSAVNSAFRASLQLLNMSHNRLTSVHPAIAATDWPNYEDTTLDFSHNLLVEVYANVVSRKGAKLYLDHNPPLKQIILVSQLVETINPEIFRLTGLEILDISGVFISRLPTQLGELTGLRVLRMRRNGFSFFPTQLGALSRLEVLDLGRNRFTAVPAALRHMTALQELDVSSNFVSELPTWLGEARSLRLLTINNNPGLSALPSEMAQCVNMTYIDMNRLPIEELPAVIRSWNATLEALVVYSTNLTRLPTWIGELRQLTTFVARFTHLRVNSSSPLFRLPHLQLLDLIQTPNPPSVFPAHICADANKCAGPPGLQLLTDVNIQELPPCYTNSSCPGIQLSSQN